MAWGPKWTSFKLRGSGSGIVMTCPGFSALRGRSEIVRDGAGCAAVPGAAQDTVTCVFGSAPHVRCSCSGSVVVGGEGALLDGDIEQAASADDGTDDGRAFQDGTPGNAVAVIVG